MTTYEVGHRTVYGYDREVTSSYGRAYLLPRDAPGQICHGGRITVEPDADLLAERADFYGNRASYLEVRTPHRELVVECRSLVEVTRQPADLTTLGTRAWDT